MRVITGLSLPSTPCPRIRNRIAHCVGTDGHLLKQFSFAVALLMLTCGGATADLKIKSFNKNPNITIKRDVVNGDSSFNQWESDSQHPHRFQSSPAHKP